MYLRKLLIDSKPKNEVEAKLKKMYKKRVIEMFKRTLNAQSIFNIFDEIFHGLSQTSQISINLYSFYEALLTITSYYQHSQAGRGNLIAKLLEEFGATDKMANELFLVNLPQWLGQKSIIEVPGLLNEKFDIVNKINDNLIFCELKMKVYSGCTAGRVELMEKFNKFIKLILKEQNFRNSIKSANIKNIFLIGGILFDIQGDPATQREDQDFGICHNGLIRGRNDIIKTLVDFGILYEIDEKRIPEVAFTIKFSTDNLNINITTVYGNEVIKSLFLDSNKYDIHYFKNLMEEILYDDLWLAQMITINERTILNVNYKQYKKLNNYVLTILNNPALLSEIEKFRNNKNINTLEKITYNIMEMINKFDNNLLNIRPILTEMLFNSLEENYYPVSYISDIIQLLACKELTNHLNISKLTDNKTI